MSAITLNSRSQLLHVFGNITSATTTVIVNAAGGSAPAVPSGQRASIFSVIMTVAGTSPTVQFQDTGSNNLSQIFQLVGGGGLALDLRDNGDFWWQATALGLGLQIVTGGTITSVGYDIYWYPTV